MVLCQLAGMTYSYAGWLLAEDVSTWSSWGFSSFRSLGELQEWYSSVSEMVSDGDLAKATAIALSVPSPTVWLNYCGELMNVYGAFFPQSRANVSKPETLDMHCSGFVRAMMAPDGVTITDIYTGHDTFAFYYSMLRIFKHYNFTFTRGTSHRVSFSSSPAYLASIDDYYITGSQLVVLETTNDIFNATLYEEIAATNGTGVVMTWIRSIVANALGNSGASWVENFAYLQSGTYPNQWIVVDYKLLDSPSAGLVTIFEEAPGFWQSSDVSSFLTQGWL